MSCKSVSEEDCNRPVESCLRKSNVSTTARVRSNGVVIAGLSVSLAAELERCAEPDTLRASKADTLYAQHDERELLAGRPLVEPDP